jgi:hypothetical protein
MGPFQFISIDSGSSCLWIQYHRKMMMDTFAMASIITGINFGLQVIDVGMTKQLRATKSWGHGSCKLSVHVMVLSLVG